MHYGGKMETWIPTLYHTQNQFQVEYKPKCQMQNNTHLKNIFMTSELKKTSKLETHAHTCTRMHSWRPENLLHRYTKRHEKNVHISIMIKGQGQIVP